MRKAHVKFCKNVSNDGQYHVVMSYDVGMSAFISKEESGALLALCSGLLTPALIAWTALSTRDDLPTTNVSYDFVTRLITCQNP